MQSANAGGIIIGSGVSSTPAGYKLYVEQGILTEKVKVAVKSTAEWSDKVFAPSYVLAPLVEVGQYIQANRHLPGVASAEQMVQQGNDLHKTDAKLLEKIEELTLYLLEQHEEMKAVKAQNKKMQQQLNQLMKDKKNR